MTLERLHKRIASAGVCSRRAAETMIEDGRVSVNGVAVSEMGVKVGPDDRVTVDGVVLEYAQKFYLVMNKPKGVLTTMSDPQHRKTVVQLLPRLKSVVKPVGRLDKETEGLLMFTNDGELAQRMMHPKYALDKEYVVCVRGIPDIKLFDKLSKGVWIPEGGKTRPAAITGIRPDPEHDRCNFHITLHEGRKRQIRQMCVAIGHPVKDLKRVRIGPIELKSLGRGVCRMLTDPELDSILQAVGMQQAESRPKLQNKRRQTA